MDDEPDIIKELREAEKLGVLQSKVQSEYEKLETVEEMPEDVPDKTVGFVKDSDESETVNNGSDQGYVPNSKENIEFEFRDLVENVNDLIQAVRPDGTFLYVNSAWKKTLGYTDKDLKKLSIFEIIHPSSKEHCMTTFKRIMSGEKVDKVEAIFVSKNGKEIVVEGCSSCRFDNGKPVSTCGIFRDVTERKMAEKKLKKSEERFKDISLSMADWIWEVDKDGIYTFASGNIKKILGYTPEEIIGKTPFDLMPEDEAKRVGEIFKEIVNEKKPIVDLENWNLTKQGENICLLTNGIPLLSEKGELMGYRGVDKDITERKRAKDKLRDSEIKFRNIFESDMVGTIFWNAKGDITDANDRFLKMVGYTKDEVLKGKVRWKDMTPPEYRHLDEKALKEISSKGFCKPFEKEYIRKDGSRVPILLGASLTPGYKNNGVCFVLDITERKKIDEEKNKLFHDVSERIKELNCLYRASKIVENADDSLSNILQKTVDLIPPSWQYPEVTCARIIFERQEFKTKNFNETKWKQTANIIISGEKKGVIEVYHLEEKPESTDGPFLKEERHLIDGLGIQLGNIIKRKQAEETIQQQNTFLNTILESLTHPFYVINANDFSIKMTNTAAGGGNSSGKSSTCYELTHKRNKPCETKEHLCPLKEVMKTKKPVTVEHTHYDKNGKARIFEVHGFPIFDVNGNVVQMIEYSLDITKRKKAEEKIKKSEEKWRSLTKNTDDTIMIVDNDNVIQYVNKMIPPTTPESVVGKTVYEYMSKEHHDIMRKSLKKVYETGQPGSYEVSLNMANINPELGILWLNTKVVPIKQDKKTVGVILISSDITKDKQTDEALKESAERYHELIEGSHDGYLMTDVDGKIIECNSIFKKITGYTDEEVHQKTYKDITPKEWYSKEEEIIKDQVLNRGYSNVYEKELIGKDGRIISVELRTYLSKQKDKSQGMWSFVRDITDRKQTEDELMTKINDLERYKNITVGRELRIIELKEKVKKLEQKLEKKSE